MSPHKELFVVISIYERASIAGLQVLSSRLTTASRTFFLILSPFLDLTQIALQEKIEMKLRSFFFKKLHFCDMIKLSVRRCLSSASTLVI